MQKMIQRIIGEIITIESLDNRHSRKLRFLAMEKKNMLYSTEETDKSYFKKDLLPDQPFLIRKLNFLLEQSLN